MEKFYGSQDMKPCFQMTEVPFTKSSLDDYMLFCNTPKLQENFFKDTLQPMNNQMKTVKALNLWYINHLTAMNALQQCKDLEEIYNSKKDICYFSAAPKPKQQSIEPHIDLQNYLTSIVSRQQKLLSFGKISKAWEKYFEKAIPGWIELKQIQKIDLGLLEVTTKNLTAAKKSKRKNKAQKKASLGTRHSFDLPIKLLTQTSAQKFMTELTKGKKRENVLGAPISLENKVREYLLKTAVTRIQQLGNVNNEILFNQAYDRYLSNDEQNGIAKRKKIKPKLNKKIKSSDKIVPKKYKNTHKSGESLTQKRTYFREDSIKHNRDIRSNTELSKFNINLRNSVEILKSKKSKQNNMEYLRPIDDVIKENQRALENLLSYRDFGRKNDTRYKHSNTKHSPSKIGSNTLSQKIRSSHSILTTKTILRKHASKNSLQTTSKMHLSMQESQSKQNVKNSLTEKSSTVETPNSTWQCRTVSKSLSVIFEDVEKDENPKEVEKNTNERRNRLVRFDSTMHSSMLSLRSNEKHPVFEVKKEDEKDEFSKEKAAVITTDEALTKNKKEPTNRRVVQFDSTSHSSIQSYCDYEHTTPKADENEEALKEALSTKKVELSNRLVQFNSARHSTMKNHSDRANRAEEEEKTEIDRVTHMPSKKVVAKNKTELRNQLADMVNAVLSSNIKPVSIKAYNNPGIKRSQTSISESTE